jgi:hypothetical protein
MPHPSSVTEAEVELLHASLPDFRIDSVPGVGQYIHEEHPTAVLAAVSELVATTTVWAAD